TPKEEPPDCSRGSCMAARLFSHYYLFGLTPHGSLAARAIRGQAVEQVRAPDYQLVRQFARRDLAAVHHTLRRALAYAKHLGGLIHRVESFPVNAHAHSPILIIQRSGGEQWH